MKNLWRRVLSQFRFTPIIDLSQVTLRLPPHEAQGQNISSHLSGSLSLWTMALFYASNSTDLLFLLQGQQSLQDGQSSFIHHIHYNFMKFSCVTGSRWDVLINNIDRDPLLPWNLHSSRHSDKSSDMSEGEKWKNWTKVWFGREAGVMVRWLVPLLWSSAKLQWTKTEEGKRKGCRGLKYRGTEANRAAWVSKGKE